MPAFSLMMLIVSIGLLLGGGALLWLGLRGQRVGYEPRCRRCDYILTGTTSQTCSECGATIDDKGVVWGARRRIALAFVPGILAMILALTGAGIVGTGALQTVNKYRYYPFNWVMKDAQNGTGAAFQEIQSRYQQGRLSRARIDLVAEEALRQQAVATIGPLTQLWIDLLDIMDTAGDLSQLQTDAYFDNSRQYSLNVRPWVRAGENIPLNFQFSGRGPSGSSSTVNLAAEQPIRMGSHEVTIYLDCWNGSSSVGVTGWCNAIGSSSELAIGQHNVHLVLKERQFDHMPSKAEREKPLSPRRERVIELSGSMEILPSDSPDSIELVTDPSLAYDVRAAIRFDRTFGLTLYRQNHADREKRSLGFTAVIGTTNGGTVCLPVDVAFDVVHLVDGHELKVDTLLLKAGTNTMRIFKLDVDRLDNRMVTIQLRPNPDLARATVDYFEIWGETITYENIEFVEAD